MSVNIVTGYTGVAHVTSDDDRAKNSAIFGNSKFILDYGKKFAYEKLNNNQIRIKDGMAINQGTQMGIELNDFEDVVIDNGTSGKTRIDLIVLRYEKSLDSGKESASLQVIKGTEADSSPSIPNYLSGNILDGGDLIDDMPLYSVTISSLTISEVTAFSYTELTDLPEYYAKTSALIAELEEKISRYTSGSVTGVKGSSETVYRSGDVNIDLKDLVSTDKSAVTPPLPELEGELPRIVVLKNPNDDAAETYAIGFQGDNIWKYYRSSGDDSGKWGKIYPRRTYISMYKWSATSGESYKSYTIQNFSRLLKPNLELADVNSLRIEVDKFMYNGAMLLNVQPMILDITSLVNGTFSPNPLTQSPTANPRYMMYFNDTEYVRVYSGSLEVHLDESKPMIIYSIRLIAE